MSTAISMKVVFEPPHEQTMIKFILTFAAPVKSFKRLWEFKYRSAKLTTSKFGRFVNQEVGVGKKKTDPQFTFF